LPFFYHKNWLDITSAADTQDMGLFTPCVYSTLVSANGITGTSIVINVYAWAEEIKLHAPTTKLAMQSSEFDYKPSQIASAVAAATGALSRIPIIGPYMKATSSVTKSFAKTASSLGFTNVPNMATVAAYKPLAFPMNSSCEVSVPNDRTTVDPHNEVCLDPRTVGLDGTDELSLAYIAGRESWIGNAILASTDSVDNLTFGANVTPAIIYSSNISDSSKPIQFTPCGYVANLFKYWRGDMIFRFKFICTRFHKGRVRITWDPKNNITTSVPDYTTVFNEVVDIGAEQDIEFRVPYSQALTFLETYPNVGNFTFNGSALSTDTYSNGIITMRVVNPLSGPIATTSIPVMIFVRAADNIEFAQPLNRLIALGGSGSQYTPYALQSGEVEYPVKPKQVVVGNVATTPDPNRYLVHFGECVKSFRPLLHRYLLQYSVQTSAYSTAATLNLYHHTTSRRLKYFGYTPNAYWTGNKTVGVGTTTVNYIRTTMHQMVSLLFIGQRGSINHSFNVEGIESTNPRTFQRMTLCKYDKTITPSANFNVYANNTSTSINNQAVINLIYQPEPYSGVALTDQRIQPAISANFPYYSNFNFQFVNPNFADKGSSVDGTDTDNIDLFFATLKVGNTTPNVVNAWSAYGHDYNFFFFINCPSLYGISIPNGV